MTLNELVYDIMELMRGHLSDDEDIDPRQVAYWIRTQRAVWVTREVGKDQGILPSLEQDLGCVVLTVVDSAECSIEGGCMVLRTQNKIPVPMSDNGKLLLTRVGPVDKMQTNFNLVHYERAKYAGQGRFVKKEVMAFYMNGYVYLAFHPDVKMPALLTHLNVRGVFEDPAEVGAFSDCTGLACYGPNSNYPVPARYVDYIKEYVVKNYARLKIMLPTDDTNDADGTIRSGGRQDGQS